MKKKTTKKTEKILKTKASKTKAETPEVLSTPVVIIDSEEKKAFRALIESYKVSNPEKYEVKRAELERQLSELN